MQPAAAAALAILVCVLGCWPVQSADTLDGRDTEQQLTYDASYSTYDSFAQKTYPSLGGTRQLLQSLNISANSTNSSCSCQTTSDSNVYEDPCILVLSQFGGMPSSKHLTYLFLQQQQALGSHARVVQNAEAFTSPSDLAPLLSRFASYDYTIIEQWGVAGTLTGSGASKNIFPAPAWLRNYNGVTSSQALAAAQAMLLPQCFDPASSRPVILVYRQDILAAQGLPVPETWDQLLQAAAQVNGTDMNGDGVGDWAICVDVDPGCKLYWLFSAVAASILQANGTSSGYLLDPATGEYLIQSVGMTVALRLWARLLHYNTPEQGSKTFCGVWEDTFAQGKCAFTLGIRQLDSHNTFLNTMAYGRAYSAGRIGIAPTPGSTVVYDRASRTMANCTPKLCPFATPLSTTVTASTATNAASPSQQPALFVNRAPVLSRISNMQENLRGNKPVTTALRAFEQSWDATGATWLPIAFNPVYFTSPVYQRFLALANPNFKTMDWSTVNQTYYNSTQYLLDMYSWVDGLRNRTVWQPVEYINTFDYFGSTAGPRVGATSTANDTVNSTAGGTSTANGGASSVNSGGAKPKVFIPLYLAFAEYLGLGRQEAAQTAALGVWSQTHPNAVLDVQMVSPLRIMTAAAATQIAQGVNESLIFDDLGYKIGLWKQIPANVWTKQQYNLDIGYVEPVTYRPGVNSTTDDSSSLHPGLLAAAITVPVVIVLLALAVVAYLAIASRKRAGYDMFGKVRPPSLGPATSLLVTDIQNSTHLWEVLPADVMDEAVQLHHTILRDKLQQHKGYETCTEGDSFILAFHTPRDALQYCVAVQYELLGAAWPQQLLWDDNAAQDAGEVQLQWKSGAMVWCDGRTLMPFNSSRSAAVTAGMAMPEPARPFFSSVFSWRLGSRAGSGRLSSLHSSQQASSLSATTFNHYLESPKATAARTFSNQLTDSLRATQGCNLRSSVTDDGKAHQHVTEPAAAVVDGKGGGLEGAWPCPSQSRLAGHPLGSKPIVHLGPQRDTSPAGLGAPAQSPPGSGSHSSYLPTVVTGSTAVVPKAATASPRLEDQHAVDFASSQLYVVDARMQQQWVHGDTLESWLNKQVHACAGNNGTKIGDGATAASTGHVAFRGLCVRMGLHAGLTDPHSWNVNQAIGRWCASGPVLAACKAVADAGAGGMILLSRDFWKALQPFGVPPDCLVLHMGEHQLKEHEPAAALYLALPTTLACRLAVFAPLRTLKITSPSILAAPMGQAAVVFMNVVGVGALRSWDAQVTQDALHMYNETVSHALLEWGGYLMELANGLCLASFTDPAAAVCWALSAQEDLLTQDWDPRILQHELCEEVSIQFSGQHARHSTQSMGALAPATITVDAGVGTGVTAETTYEVAVRTSGHNTGDSGHAGLMCSTTNLVRRSFCLAGMAARRKVVLRGLRIKVGIDVGDIHSRVNPATGRMAYMGKVMNRTARIAAQASSSQVLCSMQAWTASCLSTNNGSFTGCIGSQSLLPPSLRGLPPVVGTSLGARVLKGISEPMQLVHCSLESVDTAGFN